MSVISHPEILELERKLINQSLYQAKGSFEKAAKHLRCEKQEIMGRVNAVTAFQKGMEAILHDKSFMYPLSCTDHASDILMFLCSDTPLNELIGQSKEDASIEQEIYCAINELDEQGLEDARYHRNTEEIIAYLYCGLVLNIQKVFVLRDSFIFCKDKNKRKIRDFANYSKDQLPDSPGYLLYKGKIDAKLGIGQGVSLASYAGKSKEARLFASLAD